MSHPLPSVFHPSLTTVRLEQVARWLLDELYATEDDLTRDTDNGYTRGCTTFGRQKNRVVKEWRSRQFEWLGVLNSNNDLVFTIGDVPCRFSNDDASNPSKDAVLTANRHQLDFFTEADKGKPARFCFVIDRTRGHDDSVDPRVEFLGFAASGEIVCRWISSEVRVFRIEGQAELPSAVEVNKPQVTPKRRDEGDVNASVTK
ncbi:hypothetical protein [Nitrospirillum viridazoti]|uniref:Uncharacterized protein n=1 Tax=Nitrospirillum viridazoti CBAmc TaxID=1441467 RepID=A0A248K1G1_9PROT|nr:hypothetical protein [Nitrospirillum amazonense]ASG24813.1 hypothetical protein Y958_24500 [Nitrospirillum amazonense CBAmc]TWB40927.1 hypothetical protein FBZ91_104283 [Nitrospirillum amazonense]